jgi:tetratricopeptide (TPR) repeat protein
MKDAYKANQVAIQIKSSEAWIKFAEAKPDEALILMQRAAGMEDSTEKHPVTPCEVIPARELLGDLLMEMKQPEKALMAYELNLNKHPNRFNGLYGAGLAAEQSGNREKAKLYFEKLLSVTNSVASNRDELKHAKEYLAKS